MQCASSTAMKLISTAEQREEAVAALAGQPLGRHVEQPIPPLAHAAHHGRTLIRRQRAVVAGRGHAVADEVST